MFALHYVGIYSKCVLSIGTASSLSCKRSCDLQLGWRERNEEDPRSRDPENRVHRAASLAPNFTSRSATCEHQVISSAQSANPYCSANVRFAACNPELPFDYYSCDFPNNQSQQPSQSWIGIEIENAGLFHLTLLANISAAVRYIQPRAVFRTS